ncbi:MAG: lipid-A-disaccharide synthase [Bacteroidales bacterium]|nr:lipid-A-disaccharide synthase [Bacteroidales bacterium]MDE6146606.1 lipid-A-disaccharide synthase [Bacteroidales bacterium]
MKYYIIAGEASGDLHGSNLMKGIYSEDPQASIRFWGGDLMHEVFSRCQEGKEGGLVKHYKEGAIIGFVEVLVKARQLLGNVSFCKKDIEQWQPDVVILIDYPGFNFKIAEFAHKKGFKVFYYIAPKVWASREGRIKKLKAYVDKLFIVFPFEIPYFDSKGISYIYKGNPLVDAVDGSKAMLETRQDFLKRNNLEDRPVIAMLAGSRKGEINTMMPVLKEFAHKMHKLPQYSEYQFLIAGAPARSMEDYSGFLGEEDKFIKVLFGETQSIIRHAEAAVVNSGTASLETVLFNTPQVVGYIGNPLTFLIAKHIVKIKYISLGNLIIDRLAFKELIQDDCNPDALVAEVRGLLEDKAYRDAMLKEYAEIRSALGGSGASSAVAKAMLEELGSIK